MNIVATVTGGPYVGRGRYEGPLAKCPVTTLVPEGILSARTAQDAEKIRLAIRSTLVGGVRRVVLTAVGWQIQVELA